MKKVQKHKNEKIKFELSKEDYKILSDAIDLSLKQFEEEKGTINVYLQYAERIGNISRVGDKYTENVKMYDLRDEIKKHIDSEKEKLYTLRNRLYGIEGKTLTYNSH